jgi:hypothetical protein
MALACQVPLQQFLDIISKCESGLGTSSTSKSKAQWAIHMNSKVQKLQASVTAKVISIELLLATHTSHESV